MTIRWRTTIWIQFLNFHLLSHRKLGFSLVFICISTFVLLLVKQRKLIIIKYISLMNYYLTRGVEIYVNVVLVPVQVIWKKLLVLFFLNIRYLQTQLLVHECQGGLFLKVLPPDQWQRSLYTIEINRTCFMVYCMIG